MISYFLNFESKQFFRSMFWQKSIFINIVLVIIGLLLSLCFLSIGVGCYYILEKEFPLEKPMAIMNSVMLFGVFGELIFRYLMQKLPVMNIKPMLLLPIKKIDWFTMYS